MSMLYSGKVRKAQVSLLQSKHVETSGQPNKHSQPPLIGCLPVKPA